MKIAVLSMLVAVAMCLQACGKPVINYRTVDFKSVKDGEYQGVGEWRKYKAVVRVKVSDGRLVSAALTQHIDHKGLGKPAEAILQTVVEKQTMDVDAVTGATISSKVILMALGNALSQGTEDTNR